MKEKVVMKLMSARFLIALGVLAVFVALSLNGKLSSEQVFAVIVTVTAFYFGKERAPIESKEE